ncbi:MAG: response regulator transcription factor [Chitinophagaceae bacterium]|nr:response regulator transcription factor [Chitinophagaceae bacterium]
MSQLRTYIILDDNEADCLMSKALLSQYKNFKFLKSFSSAEEVLAEINELNPDIAFLDIDMPGMNGIELRKTLHTLEVCIFITSHPEFALEGFELAAFDYIIKPLTMARIDKTMDRLLYYFEIKDKAHLLDYKLGSDHIMIKDGIQKIRIPTHQILYLEAYKDYTKVITSEKNHCVLNNLGKLIQEDAFKHFVRIHKSYAVQPNLIEKFTSKEVLIRGTHLPIGRSYKSNLNGLGE